MHLLEPNQALAGERLTGGVSSDIWRIDLPAGPVCVKRALAKLRVAADWQAPIERNRYEARWMQRGQCRGPGCGAALLGPGRGDRRAGDGSFCRRTAIRCGRRSCATATPIRRSPRRSRDALVRIHAATAADPVDRRRRSRPIGSSTTSGWSPTWSRRRAAHPDLRRCAAWRWWRRRRPTSARWCMATSARRTSCAARTARCSWMPSAPGGAIRRSTWRSASITCC